MKKFLIALLITNIIYAMERIFEPRPDKPDTHVLSGKKYCMFALSIKGIAAARAASRILRQLNSPQKASQELYDTIELTGDFTPFIESVYFKPLNDLIIELITSGASVELKDRLSRE